MEALTAQLETVGADRDSLQLMLDRLGRLLDAERLQRFASSQVGCPPLPPWSTFPPWAASNTHLTRGTGSRALAAVY